MSFFRRHFIAYTVVSQKLYYLLKFKEGFGVFVLIEGFLNHKRFLLFFYYSVRSKEKRIYSQGG